MNKIGYYSYQSHFEHDVGDEHPEHPFRILAIESQLEESELASFICYHEGKSASQGDVLRAHPQGYLHQLEQIIPENGSILVDRDTPYAPGSLASAYNACGCALMALDDLLIEKKFPFSFCAVRPPGHHAEKNKAMGFCFINHVAVATLKAIEEYQLKRVLVVDFDVHQANGTIDILGSQASCMLMTSFQHPYYPNSHWQNDHENVINTPLDAGTDSQQFRQAITNQWLAKISDYQPELVIFSAGFDAHRLDPTADLLLESEDYQWLSEQFKERINCPVLAVLEGGYDLKGLAESVEAFITPFIKS